MTHECKTDLQKSKDVYIQVRCNVEEQTSEQERMWYKKHWVEILYPQAWCIDRFILKNWVRLTIEHKRNLICGLEVYLNASNQFSHIWMCLCIPCLWYIHVNVAKQVHGLCVWRRRWWVHVEIKVEQFIKPFLLIEFEGLKNTCAFFHCLVMPKKKNNFS